MKSYPITPCPKPRQTRADVWKKRPPVMRYRAFADKCRALGVVVPESGAVVTFILPMPKSWSKKKRAKMDGEPHQQVPDIDNLLKSILDAVYENDCRVWDIHPIKRWGIDGRIDIE